MRRTDGMLRAAMILVCLVTGSMSGASAQVATAGLRMQSFAATDAEGVGFDGTSLMFLPWSAAYSLTSWVVLDLDGNLARASLTLPSGDRWTIQGLTSTRVGLRLGANRWGLDAAVMLPGGEVPRTVQEAGVVGVLASDLLPFGIDRWGSAAGVSVDASVGERIGRTTARLMAGLSKTTELPPLEGFSSGVAPGMQMRVRMLLDREIGAASVLSVLMGVQRFATDTYAGSELVTPGHRYEALVSLAFPIGARESVMLLGGVLHRSESEGGRTARDEPAPIEVLFPGVATSSARSLAHLGLEARISRDRWTFVPRTELRLLRDAAGIGQGWVTTIGTRGAHHLRGERLGRRLVLRPSVALQAGEIVRDAAARSRIWGWEAGVALEWNLGR